MLNCCPDSRRLRSCARWAWNLQPYSIHENSLNQPHGQTKKRSVITLENGSLWDAGSFSCLDIDACECVTEVTVHLSTSYENVTICIFGALEQQKTGQVVACPV